MANELPSSELAAPELTALALTTSLREQQLQFANHLRDPENNPAPQGIEERRLQIYRKLFFGNISNLLANTFPVIHSILPEPQWQALVRDFYAHHRCETPLFPFIAGEFVDYLADEAPENPDYPFLAELGFYEWTEIALRHSEVDALPEVVANKPQLSPLCWPLAFRWPVHRIGLDYCPIEPPETATFLLVYRDATDQVKFIESNAATFRLLALLNNDDYPDIAAVTARLATELGYQDLDALETVIAETLRQLQAWQLVVINS